MMCKDIEIRTILPRPLSLSLFVTLPLSHSFSLPHISNKRTQIYVDNRIDEWMDIYFHNKHILTCLNVMHAHDRFRTYFRIPII